MEIEILGLSAANLYKWTQSTVNGRSMALTTTHGTTGTGRRTTNCSPPTSIRVQTAGGQYQLEANISSNQREHDESTDNRSTRRRDMLSQQIYPEGLGRTRACGRVARRAWSEVPGVLDAYLCDCSETMRTSLHVPRVRPAVFFPGVSDVPIVSDSILSML